MRFITAFASTTTRCRRRDALPTASPTVARTRPSTQVDEACADDPHRDRLSMPAELDDLRRKIMAGDRRDGPPKEDDQPPATVSRSSRKSLPMKKKSQFNAMKSRWEAEKSGVDSVKAACYARSSRCTARSSAQANLSTKKAAKPGTRDLPAPRKKAAQGCRGRGRKHTGDNSMVHDTVTENEIAGDIVGKWTGIPVSRLMEGERESCCALDEIILQACRRSGTRPCVS